MLFSTINKYYQMDSKQKQKERLEELMLECHTGDQIVEEDST